MSGVRVSQSELFCYCRKYKVNVVNNIILITQRESVKLQELGYNFASRFKDGLLHKSKTSHQKYYLTEDKKALKDLYKLRKNSIVK